MTQTALESLSRPKMRDVIVERLKGYIVSQKLVAGDRLPTETTLAEQFGVSRVSLREATKALELFGILEAKAGVGLTVGQIDLDKVTRHLGFHPSLLNSSEQELINTRLVVETGALPFAAARIEQDPSLCDRLQEIVDDFGNAKKLQDWIDLEIQFHRTLLETSGIRPLVAFNDVLEIFFRRFRTDPPVKKWHSNAKSRERVTQSHQRIVNALRTQSVQEADQELRSHIGAHSLKKANSKQN